MLSPHFQRHRRHPSQTKLRLSRAPLSNDSYRKDGRGESEMLLAKPCEIHKSICGCVVTLEIGSTVQKCPKESSNPTHFIHDSNVIPLFQVNEKVRLTLFSIHISHILKIFEVTTSALAQKGTTFTWQGSIGTEVAPTWNQWRVKKRSHLMATCGRGAKLQAQRHNCQHKK